MTTIVEALKQKEIGRIQKGNCWLVWDIVTEKWVVRQSAYLKQPVIICETTDEAEAVAALLGEESDE